MIFTNQTAFVYDRYTPHSPPERLSGLSTSNIYSYLTQIFWTESGLSEKLENISYSVELNVKGMQRNYLMKSVFFQVLKQIIYLFCYFYCQGQTNKLSL